MSNLGDDFRVLPKGSDKERPSQSSMTAIDRARTEKGFVDAHLSYKMGLPTRLHRETEREGEMSHGRLQVSSLQ